MEERTATPGADTSGLISPQGDGPRALKPAMLSYESVAPTAKTPLRLAGEPTVPGPGPLLPAAKTVRMPAARRMAMSASNTLSVVFSSSPQELLTMSGARLGSGSEPSSRVGARHHSKPR